MDDFDCAWSFAGVGKACCFPMNARAAEKSRMRRQGGKLRKNED